MKSAVAIITARGGSKRIPRKNIKDFLGKPIIAYAIEAAKKSGLFQSIIVSTDDDEIAKVAQKYGAEIPFRRSQQNSNDQANTNDVLLETFDSFKKTEKNYRYACCIYPTAVFTTPKLLQAAAKILEQGENDLVFPCVPYTKGHLQIFEKKDKDRLVVGSKSLDAKKLYHDAGQFYFFDVEKFLKRGDLMSPNTQGIFLQSSEAQDIDDSKDWASAELKYKELNK